VAVLLGSRKGLQVPNDDSRYKESVVEVLLAYCRQNGRVCPIPLEWKALYEMLPNKSCIGAEWEPPPPLILGAWYDASDEAKMQRLADHIIWAEQHGSFGMVESHLHNLREENWYHLCDDLLETGSWQPWWLVERERPLVLLVNDNSVETIEQVLTASGYDVHIKSKILDAIEWARQLHPHVAIVGNFIPVRERIQLANELSRYCEVILSAADDFDEQWDLIFEPGDFATLLIPVDKGELLDRARKCVYKSEKKRMNAAKAALTSADPIKESTADVAAILDAEIARAEQSGCCCWVLCVKITEKWQEHQGDALLRGMRNLQRALNEKMEFWCLPHAVRLLDLGDSYFTIILPQAPNSTVESFANQLHSLIRATDWRQLVGGSVFLTGFISAVTFPQDGTSAGELLERIWLGTGGPAHNYPFNENWGQNPSKGSDRAERPPDQ
jgi:hypothetical protein